MQQLRQLQRREHLLARVLLANADLLETDKTRNKHSMGCFLSSHNLSKNKLLLPTAMADDNRRGARAHHWGDDQTARLRRLVDQGHIDPNSVNQRDFAAYAVRVTQEYFPDFINENNTANAVRRLKSKLNTIVLERRLNGSRGESCLVAFTSMAFFVPYTYTHHSPPKYDTSVHQHKALQEDPALTLHSTQLTNLNTTTKTLKKTWMKVNARNPQRNRVGRSLHRRTILGNLSPI